MTDQPTAPRTSLTPRHWVQGVDGIIDHQWDEPGPCRVCEAAASVPAAPAAGLREALDSMRREIPKMDGLTPKEWLWIEEGLNRIERAATPSPD